MRSLLFSLLFALPAAAQEAPALIRAARAQVGVTTIYDPSYQSLAFPGGDVDPAHGVCTDVIIRALRTAWGVDLQLAVNRDMKAHFSAYPKQWGLKTTDRNIDHRRVPNLQTLFTRIGADLPVSRDPADYHPGDVVTWMLPGNLPHIGLISDARSDDGTRPQVLHNIGAGAQEEDRLFDFPITGHYRLNPEAVAELIELGR
ncbi:MAG: DUF1287 domain-containing protein [Cypionkella sp.]|uniref:DUF1287 domain-containing protein n=1 Tax=Cypionkella sp. TaxID=2811411 RepID=UPI002AB95E5E|nr:DUF1287 domain-containing protein [Cypionkella sp.]MDZ4309606.1 DUF1287 domain-containing protein [Cypionkella sp.]